MNLKTFLSPAVVSITVLWMATAVVAGEAWKAAPMDWPHWRGPEMNGISREKGLIDRWSPRGKNLLWKRDDLPSRSTPIVMNGRLYTILRDRPETKYEGEKVVCLDAATGKTLWKNRFNVFLSDVPDTRVGWSSVAGDPSSGNVYALGVCGHFQCLDGKTGKTIWSHSLSEEFGLLSTYGGRTNFPVIHGNLVIISAIVIGWGDMAKPAHRFIAFDKQSGRAVWFEGTRLLPYDTTYSSPITTVINGQAAMIFGSGDGGVHAFQPRTGKKIWTYNVSRRGINTTPLVVGNTVFAGHSEENIDDIRNGALFAIDATQSGDVTHTGELWRVKKWFVGKSSPIFVDGKLIAIEDNANLLVIDPKTGKRIARKKLGTSMRSSPLYADGKIYACTTNGRWYILKLDGKKIKVVHRMRLRNQESHGSPIVSHGRIYFPTTSALYCLGREDHTPAADPRPQPPQESPVQDDPEPAHLQVVPVDSLLKPGQKRQFQVRLYNSRGQLLKTENANIKFSIDGPGSISPKGMYTAPDEGGHAAVFVSAVSGGLSGDARIRVIPESPWSFDFSDGRVPITWVGARYRHISVDFDLLQSLKDQNPRAEQLYIYLMTSFINGGRSTVKCDDSSPRRPAWTNLLRFLDLNEGVKKPKTLSAARQRLDPALELLAKEQVIARWNWAEDENTGIQLMVARGERRVDGNGVMLKVKTIPKGARSQAWMGHPSLGNYTIQADVLGAMKNNKLPDLGLIGQRYVINMIGSTQELQIRSWPTVLRMAKTVPFPWKPNVWYTMKFQTAVEGDKAVIRAKVWPREESEPEQWTIEAVDVSPNANGSPGLYGNAINAEIFYDNIKVMKN